MQSESQPLQVLYGIDGHYTDVTRLAKLLIFDEVLYIREGDLFRCTLFGGDPLPGVLKHVKIIFGNQTKYVLACSSIQFPVPGIDVPLYPENRIKAHEIALNSNLSEMDRLAQIHQLINPTFFVDMRHEYNEQLMNLKFVKPNAKVLELGSNVGCNALLIASILDDDRNLVTLETDPDTYTILNYNKKRNGYNFHSVNAALSARRIIQQGHFSRVSDQTPHNAFVPNIIGFDDLQKAYDIEFDTLVLDCEGAIYNILKDFPHMLDNIHTISIENDFLKYEEYVETHAFLKEKGFESVYTQSGNPGHFCSQSFFQVVQRNIGKGKEEV